MKKGPEQTILDKHHIQYTKLSNINPTEPQSKILCSGSVRG